MIIYVTYVGRKICQEDRSERRDRDGENNRKTFIDLSMGTYTLMMYRERACRSCRSCTGDAQMRHAAAESCAACANASRAVRAAWRASCGISCQRHSSAITKISAKPLCFVISSQIASVSYFFLANDRDQCAMTTIFYFQRANKFCYRKSYRNLLDSVIKSKSNLEK